MTEQDYKRNIQQQRQRLNNLNNEVRYLRAFYEIAFAEIGRLRDHANRSCTCGDNRHNLSYEKRLNETGYHFPDK